MVYRDENDPVILPDTPPDHLHPEVKVRSFIGLLLAPMFAGLGLFMVTALPSPGEIAMTSKLLGAPLVTQLEASNNGNQSIQTLAERIGTATGQTIGRNADCFEDLGLADKEKLDRCGRAVYQALAEVERTPTVFTGEAVPTRDTLVQEIKLAATEVCRQKWSRAGTLPLDSKACEIALTSLETQRD